MREIIAETRYGTSQLASESVGAFPILRMNNITYEGAFALDDVKRIDLNDGDVAILQQPYGKQPIKR